MTDSETRSSNYRSRVAMWSLAVAAVVIVPLVLFVPRPTLTITTIDGSHRWSAQDAPARREVVWQPATAVEMNGSGPTSLPYGGRHHLAENGDVIYLSIPTQDRGLDIAQMQRIEGRWSPPRIVKGLNSAGDDVGPFVNERGDVMYFCSNRNGGFGGMDIYAASREGDGWNEPANLGSQINSPANEQGPALSTDGLHLYFASDRGQSPWDPKSLTPPKDWQTSKLDLYQSRRENAEGRWQRGVPLTWMNTAAYNESDPFPSPDGVFLAFASDRPDPGQQQTDFDLYRARTDRSDLAPENYGAGVNTRANERSPLLTAVGFQLYFMRSDLHQQATYALHQSTAQEAVLDRQWDRSNLHALTAAIARVGRCTVDYFWLLLVVVTLLTVIVWLTKRLTMRDVALPGFLVLALVLHAMLMTGSFFVYFQQSITRKIQQLFEKEPVVATQWLVDPAPDSPTSPQPTFDRVADLMAPSPVQTADVARRPMMRSEWQPIEMAQPQRLLHRATISRDPLDGRVVGSVPLADATVQPSDAPAPPDFLSRVEANRELDISPVKVEPTRPVEQPTAKPVPTPTADFERPPLRSQVIPEPLRAASAVVVSPPVLDGSELPVMAQPVATTTQPPLTIERRAFLMVTALDSEESAIANQPIAPVDAPLASVPMSTRSDWVRREKIAVPLEQPTAVVAPSNHESRLRTLADAQPLNRIQALHEEPTASTGSTIVVTKKPLSELSHASVVSAVPMEVVRDVPVPDLVTSADKSPAVDLPRLPWKPDLSSIDNKPATLNLAASSPRIVVSGQRMSHPGR